MLLRKLCNILLSNQKQFKHLLYLMGDMTVVLYVIDLHLKSRAIVKPVKIVVIQLVRSLHVF